MLSYTWGEKQKVHYCESDACVSVCADGGEDPRSYQNM